MAAAPSRVPAATFLEKDLLFMKCERTSDTLEHSAGERALGIRARTESTVNSKEAGYSA